MGKVALLIRNSNNCALDAKTSPLARTTCTKTSTADTTTTNSADLSSFSNDTKDVMVALNPSADSASRLATRKTSTVHSASAESTAVILVLRRICLHLVYRSTRRQSCSLSTLKSNPERRGQVPKIITIHLIVTSHSAFRLGFRLMM